MQRPTQGSMRPTTCRPLAEALTTTPSPEAGTISVKAVMLTWWVTTTRTPGPRQDDSSCRAARVLSAVTSDSLKKELKTGWSVRFPGKAKSAVSRVRHHCEDQTAATSIRLCLNSAPMRRACARPSSLRLRRPSRLQLLRIRANTHPAAAL